MRQIAQEVYTQNSQRDVYSSFKTSSHEHNGVDSPRLNQSNIDPGLRASGSITFAQSTRYQLSVTFNPTSIFFNGIVVNNNGAGITIRAHCIGNAILGPSFYFQPSTSTSVALGGPIQDIVQSSSMFLIDSSTAPVTVRALVDEGHLVDVEYGGIKARATVADVTNGVIFVDVTVAAGYQIIGNYIVT